MKGKPKNMADLRKILIELRDKKAIGRIAIDLSSHKKTVRKMQALGRDNGWLIPGSQMPSDQEIRRAWDSKKKQKIHVLDELKQKILEWADSKDKIPVTVIRRLVKENFSKEVTEQMLSRYIKKHKPKGIEPVMVRTTVAGQDADVDFGDIGTFLTDAGILKKAYVFTMRLRHSRKAYRMIVLSQTSEIFNQAHALAFEFFGGVVEIVHPDNTKCAVIQASVENDNLNRAYQSCAEHYGFKISPCRPYTPEHKGGVEKDMSYVKNNFIKYFRAHQKEMGVTTPKISDLIPAFEKWQREVDDEHKIFGIGKSPNELFEKEKLALKPLPATRWNLVTWATCIVRNDWRVIWNHGYYSVPYCLIGKTVELYITSATVKIFHNNEEVALHERCQSKGEYKRKTEHAPPWKEEVLQCTGKGLLEQAEQIGPNTFTYAERILNNPTVDKLNPVRKLLKLAEKHGIDRLEKACERGCLFQFKGYREIKNILENRLEGKIEEVHQPEVEVSQTCREPQAFEYARNGEEYSHHENYACFVPEEADPWEEKLLKALGPFPKYDIPFTSKKMWDRWQDEAQMDELIREEERATAQGLEGPLKGCIPQLNKRWAEWQAKRKASRHQDSTTQEGRGT